jgi:hypothetical protein
MLLLPLYLQDCATRPCSLAGGRVAGVNKLQPDPLWPLQNASGRSTMQRANIHYLLRSIAALKAIHAGNIPLCMCSPLTDFVLRQLHLLARPPVADIKQPFYDIVHLREVLAGKHAAQHAASARDATTTRRDAVRRRCHDYHAVEASPSRRSASWRSWCFSGVPS